MSQIELKGSAVVQMPTTWEVVRLSEISFDFIGGGTPSTSNDDYWNGDIPWMTSAHIGGREITTGQRYITKEGLSSSASNLVPKDNLLVSTRVGIGKSAINRLDIAISQDLTGVVIDKGKVIPDYLYWFLSVNERKLKSLAQGSTIKGILREALGKLEVLLPPLPEQQKIAEILSTVDEAIGKVDKAIGKTMKLMRGLMHGLLTKGIERREFKETEIGKIPKRWAVEMLLNIATLQRGYDLPKGQRNAGKYPVIGSNGIVGYHDSFNVKGPGVIIGRSGTLGQVYYSIENYWPLNTSLYVKDFHGNHPKYIYYFFQHLDISKYAAGTGVPTLNRNLLHPVPFAVPPLYEQKEIVEILSAVDKRLELLLTRKARFKKLKKALMNDLLTGKRRVRI